MVSRINDHTPEGSQLGKAMTDLQDKHDALGKRIDFAFTYADSISDKIAAIADKVDTLNEKAARIEALLAGLHKNDPEDRSPPNEPPTPALDS